MRLTLYYLLNFLCLIVWSPLITANHNVIGVSILPQKYFVERIAGDKFKVMVMVQEGFNPVTYEPKPKQLASLKNTAIYFLANVPFEKKWISVFRNNNQNMKLVSLVKDFDLIEFDYSRNVKHHHIDSLDHGNLDPHFWLNPKLVKIAARTIRDSLSELDPEGEHLYENNYQEFIKNLDELDMYIKQKIASIRQRNFAVYHPSWGYFAKAYGLNQVAIEALNRQPGARTLNATISTIRQNGIKIIFVQKQFSETDAAMVARETGARLVRVDPLAANYIENMENVANLFEEALQ